MMIDSTGYTLEKQGLTLSKGLKGYVFELY